MSTKEWQIPAKKLQLQKGMVAVCYALVPCLFFSVYLFGWRSLAIVVVTLLAGFATEALFTFREGKPVTAAVFVTSLILALSLPPTIPLWMCALGAVVAVGLGKMAFGGMGKNIFNPAMVGRCFLYVSFPLHMTNRWADPFTGGAGGFGHWAAPFDGVTGATPLALLPGGGGDSRGRSPLRIHRRFSRRDLRPAHHPRRRLAHLSESRALAHRSLLSRRRCRDEHSLSPLR